MQNKGATRTTWMTLAIIIIVIVLFYILFTVLSKTMASGGVS